MKQTAMEDANESITVIVTRVVREGDEQAFENAVRAFIPKSLAFPGHLGVHMLRPSPGERSFGAVLKFRSHHDWYAFRQSAEYLGFLAEIVPLLEGPQQEETSCGLESWFTPLGQRVTRVPPRWKMAFVTWLGVCIGVYVVNVGLSWWPSDWLGWLKFFVVNGLVVVLLTWAIMPNLTRLVSQWLHGPE